MSLRHWLGELPKLPSPAWPTQAVQLIICSGFTETISLQYLRPDISGRTTISFEWPWPRFIHHSSSGTIPGNSSWEHFEKFLGTMPKNPGNEIYWRGPELWKGGVPGNSWEQNLLMWPKMRVCATFPGTFPGTKCPSSWEPRTSFHECHDWAEALLGTRPDKQILFGCLGFQVLPFWRCVAEEGGMRNFNPNQATSAILVRIIQQSCKCNKLIAGPTISFLSQHSHRNPWEENFGIDRTRMGVLNIFVFASFLNIPRLFWI